MTRAPLVTILISVAAVGCAASTTACGWPGVSRNAGYSTLVVEFRKATPIEPTDSVDDARWDSRMQVTGTTVTVVVTARSHMDVVRVKYSDEPKPRTLYKYVDYSNPIAIRRSGDTLYVHWGETLFHTVDWLLAYDLSARRELSRRRVDPKDLPDAIRPAGRRR